MKIKDYLKETIESVFDAYGEAVHIFSFPLSEKEKGILIKQNRFKNNYRFIANAKRKKVYIFSPSITHWDADITLYINKYEKEEVDFPIIYGQADNNFNVNKMINPFQNKKYFEVIKKADWDFATKYLKGLPEALKKWEKDL